MFTFFRHRHVSVIREARELRFFQGPNPDAHNYYREYQMKSVRQTNNALMMYIQNRPNATVYDMQNVTIGMSQGRMDQMRNSPWYRNGGYMALGNHAPVGPFHSFPISAGLYQARINQMTQQQNYVPYAARRGSLLPRAQTYMMNAQVDDLSPHGPERTVRLDMPPRVQRMQVDGTMTPPYRPTPVRRMRGQPDVTVVREETSEPRAPRRSLRAEREAARRRGEEPRPRLPSSRSAPVPRTAPTGRIDESAVSSTRDELAKTQTERNQIQAAVKRIQEEMRKIEATASESRKKMTEQIRELQEQLAKGGDVAALRTRVQTLTKTFNDMFAAGQKRVGDLTEQAAKLNTQLEALTKRAQTLQESINKRLGSI